PPASPEPCQRSANEPGHAQDRGIAEQVAQERLHRFQRIRSTEIEQDDRDLHEADGFQLRTISTSCATCSGGVCGTTPWPRLNTKEPWPSLSRMRVASRSSATPPATSIIGSRLPCRQICGCSSRAAQWAPMPVSIDRAAKASLRRYIRVAGPAARGKRMHGVLGWRACTAWAVLNTGSHS